ncbi:hypothetical protein [Pseudohongiella spirulinae]|uniref:Uncharacterized protein n=1 Tax=Pseudohongiella spirulinae TaxID=1249552 RepID=A0A0S2KC30_9GAMM|nr:hypothetical protein [Pseudohongiella spirulinae]ALO45867.1 hypothetical protein PS2015_1208 [Pseudohongiella spirulinae]
MIANTVQILRRSIAPGALLVTLAMPLSIVAQENVTEMRRAVDLFSNVLREGLGLNQRQGIFSPRNGDVQGRYLAGQGVTLSIVAPMRGTPDNVDISVRELGQSLDELALQLGGMMERGVVTRPDFDAMRDALALSLRTDEISLYYRDLMQQLTQIGSLPVMDRALAEAALQIRRLQSAAFADQSLLTGLDDELQTLREHVQSQIEALARLRRDISRQAAEAESMPEPATLAAWQATREQIELRVGELQRQLAGRMQTLRDHQATVQAEQQLARQQQMAEFEQQLFTTVCDFAGGLRDLPSGEYLNLVLVGAGRADEQVAVRYDRVYTISQRDLQDCQRGAITGGQLLETALSYEY